MKRQVKKNFLGILIAVATMAITLFAGGCGKNNVDEWFCDHKYNDGTVIVDAGCTTDGTLERTCTSCGKKKKEPIIAVGHEFDEGEVVLEATCTTTGVKEYECKKCYELKTETISAISHNKVVFAGTPATCTETGMTEGYKCSDCNTVLVGQSVIPAKGHKRIIDHVVYPTCTETGLTRGSHCEWCGEVFEMQEIMEVLGHNVVTVEGYEATCRQPGLTDGLQCDRCNTVYEEQEVIEALEHIDNDNDYVCDSCFVDVWHCNHTYGDDVIIVEATCIEKGEAKRICTQCGEYKIVILEAKGHNVVTVEGYEPNCYEPGLTDGEICDRCGAVVKDFEQIDVVQCVDRDNNNRCDWCNKNMPMLV